jgi:transposase
MYVRVAGQPPIHPRLRAKTILYGLSLGTRSSRKLEDACRNLAPVDE